MGSVEGWVYLIGVMIVEGEGAVLGVNLISVSKNNDTDLGRRVRPLITSSFVLSCPALPSVCVKSVYENVGPTFVGL